MVLRLVGLEVEIERDDRPLVAPVLLKRTLDGYDPADTSGGWGASYNFGSIEAARTRWRAAIQAGVDFVAVNQYEEFAKELHSR